MQDSRQLLLLWLRTGNRTKTIVSPLFATHFEGIRPFCREYEYLSQQLNKK